MDKKSMAIILAAIGLSAGSGLAMEHAAADTAQCAESLDSGALSKLFSNGDFIMPGTQNKFKLSSGNKDDLYTRFKEQDNMKEDRTGVFEKVESQGDEVTCHYTYRGGMKRSYIPSFTEYHTRFTVTSVPEMQQQESSIEPVIQKKLPKFGASLVTQQEKEAAIEVLDTVNPNEPINQAQWEAALIFLGIPNPETFGAYKDIEVMTGIYNGCRKKAQMDEKALSNCEKAISTAKRGINEWPADMGHKFQ